MALNLVVIAAWAGLAGVLGLIGRLLGVRFTSAPAADTFAFVTLVLPVIVTLAVQESSPRQATFGKRRVNIYVVDRAGMRLTRVRSLGRSIAKFAPWQLAHTAVFNLTAGSTGTVLLVMSITAQALVVTSVVAMTLDRQHRALHDWIAGTRVVNGRPYERQQTVEMTAFGRPVAALPRCMHPCQTPAPQRAHGDRARSPEQAGARRAAVWSS